MPIIMLPAKGRERDVITGLNLGADDYVTKPFNIGELLARANAFLRRHRVQVASAVRFGHCEFDPDARTLYRSGEEIALTPKEYDLLALFTRRPGRPLTRDTILNAVWYKNLLTSTRSVDRCVNTLRQKIETDPQRPQFIKSVRDVGYKFELPEQNR